MNGTEKVVKHLEMIQAIINRLGTNSFLVKGGSLITIIAATILALQGADHFIVNILTLTVLIPIILGFWTLDSYFLWKERLFRQVYEEVRQQIDTDFNMDVSKHKTHPKCSWRDTVFSVTLTVFYTIEIVFALLVTRCLFILFASFINFLESIR